MGEPVPREDVKEFMFEMGAEEFSSENDPELCGIADEVEAYLDGTCEAAPEALAELAKKSRKGRKLLEKKGKGKGKGNKLAEKKGKGKGKGKF